MVSLVLMQADLHADNQVTLTVKWHLPLIIKCEPSSFVVAVS